MASYNEGLDKHVANDGTWHDTAAGAEEADRYHANSGGGGGDAGGGFIGQMFGGKSDPAAGLMGAAAGIFIAILVFVPLIIAKIAAFIFSRCFKIGIAGKVIQTIIVVSVVGFLGLILGMFLSMIPIVGVFLMAFLSSVTSIIPAIWYWTRHYDEIKHIEAPQLALILKASMLVAMYGGIGALIVGGIISAVAGMGTEMGTMFPFALMAIPFAIAIRMYFKNVAAYADSAEAGKYSPETQKKALKIGLFIAIALTVIGGLISIGALIVETIQEKMAARKAAIELVVDQKDFLM